jgi:hypothetical protein
MTLPPAPSGLEELVLVVTCTAGPVYASNSVSLRIATRNRYCMLPSKLLIVSESEVHETEVDSPISSDSAFL